MTSIYIPGTVEFMLDIITVGGAIMFFMYAAYWAITNPREKNK